MTPAVSVIIVSYQSALVLTGCLRALAHAGVAWEIIVVDNASTDGSAALIRREFPHVLLLENAVNRGFAAAANQGAALARGTYLLFLNPDTELGPGAIATISRALETNPRLGAVGCQVKNPDGTLQPSMGRFPTVANLIINRLPVVKRIVPSYFINVPWYYYAARSPDWIMGACLMVRKAAFTAVGGFDEEFFLYGEDVDLCYRLGQAGWQLAYLPNAWVIHHDHGKTPSRRINKFFHLRRGLLRFYAKHYAPAALKRLKLLLRGELVLRQWRNRDQPWRAAFQQLQKDIRKTTP